MLKYTHQSATNVHVTIIDSSEEFLAYIQQTYMGGNFGYLAYGYEEEVASR